jgi:O-antigen ligase
MRSGREFFGLLPALALLVVVLHVAHLTGLRNVLAALMALWALALVLREGTWPPLGAPLLAWLGLGALSATWSADAEATLKSVLYDIIMPTGAFYAAYMACRRRPESLVLPSALGLGLAYLSGVTVLAYALGQAGMLQSHAPSGVAYYFPGPGAASTLAVFALPTALPLALDSRPSVRRLGYFALACIAVIGTGSQNRMFWVAAVLAIAAFGAWQWREFSDRQRRRVAIVLAVGTIGALATVSYLTVTRGVQEVSKDRRLQMWREWAAVAGEAPLLGYGLGKKVVVEAGAGKLSQDIVAQDRNVLSHSHNLILNLVLQLGIAGLAAFLALSGALVRAAYRARAPARLSAGAALVALVVAMLAKNTSDDVMDHAVIVAFWLYAGMLVGRLGGFSVEASQRGAQTGTNASRPR